MTRKYTILFVVLMLCFFSLISSFLGERGFLANNQLKRQLKYNEYAIDRKAVELENLKLQEQELSTEDGLRSAAMNLGYQVESDNVFVFMTQDNPVEITDLPARQILADPDNSFKPFSSGLTILISFSASFIITFIAWLFGHKTEVKEDDSEQEESGDLGNNLNLD